MIQCIKILFNAAYQTRENTAFGQKLVAVSYFLIVAVFLTVLFLFF